eukprot:scaffold14279_cov26-Tisochrysis_lutea.AAC.1
MRGVAQAMNLKQCMRTAPVVVARHTVHTRGKMPSRSVCVCDQPLGDGIAALLAKLCLKLLARAKPLRLTYLDQ